jgi:hypothetical protein
MEKILPWNNDKVLREIFLNIDHLSVYDMDGKLSAIDIRRTIASYGIISTICW